MKKSLILVGTILAIGLSTSSALAYNGVGQGERHGGGMGRSNPNSLVPQEWRNEWRSQMQNATPEERAKFREERQVQREERQKQMEQFTGLTREQRQEYHQKGWSIGDVLAKKGITEVQAKTFLENRANERISWLTQVRNLTTDQVNTLKSRVDNFVNSILNRWYE